MRLSIALLFLLALATTAPAQDALDADRLRGAIDKGKAWLLTLQQPDGSFQIPPGSDTLETGFPLGYCSLATLTLLKCGVAPDDPAIERAFQHLYSLPLEKTYSVATLVLAIEARFAPPDEAQEPEERSYTTVARRFFGRQARKIDKDRLQQCADWLVAHRSKQLEGAGWRYPTQGAAVDQDNSNTQYAMLALKSARRLGAEVPPDVFAKVADFFVAQQDAQGPEVTAFPVPAADGPILEMLGLEERREQEEKAREAREREAARAERAGGSRERAPGEPAAETLERRRMFARGWSYEPRELPAAREGTGRPPRESSGGRRDPAAGPTPESRLGPTPPQTGTRVSTGSMTASGVAALCIAKSELETNPALWRGRQGAVDAAIRDGVAWLAHHFSPTENPRADDSPSGWKYYWLYSVERAGVLAGTYTFGAHDWWEEGAAHLLTLQEPAGTWPDTKGLSRLAHSCFALLFLERSTIPLMPLPPKRVMTGGTPR